MLKKIDISDTGTPQLNIVKLQHNAGNSWEVIAFTWQIDIGLVWKGQAKVNDELNWNFDMENIAVTLHDACNSWEVVSFTR